jgi:thioredoxin-related protein
MKKLIAFLILLSVNAPSFAHGKEWLTDFSAAKKQAAAEKKRILMLFTGSDWCVKCLQWEKNVFSTPEFQEYARTNFVQVLVDFPEKRKLPKTQQRANDALKDKYNVEEYPQLYVLDAKGRELTRINFIEGGWAPLREKIEAVKN